jgi:hypothetical protein
MKLSQLALTLVLVAGGIFVYDAFLVREAAEALPETVRVEQPAPLGDEGEMPSFAVLEGRGDEIWRSDIERRIEHLEVAPAAADRTEGAADGVESGVPGAAPVEGEEGEALDENGNSRPRRFTPKDVATFRAVLETVERQRREEKTRRQMLSGLEKIGVELNDVQANQVVDLTLKLYRGFQAKTRGLPRSEENRDQRLAVFNQLKKDYADELYGIVPPAEADRIIDAINRQANRQPKDGR